MSKDTIIQQKKGDSKQGGKDSQYKDGTLSQIQELVTEFIKIKTDFGKEVMGRVYSYEDNKLLIMSNNIIKLNQLLLEIIDEDWFYQTGEEVYVSLGVYNTSNLQAFEDGKFIHLVDSKELDVKYLNEEFSHQNEATTEWINVQDIEKLQKQGHLQQYKQ